MPPQARARALYHDVNAVDATPDAVATRHGGFGGFELQLIYSSLTSNARGLAPTDSSSCC